MHSSESSLSVYVCHAITDNSMSMPVKIEKTKITVSESIFLGVIQMKEHPKYTHFKYHKHVSKKKNKRTVVNCLPIKWLAETERKETKINFKCLYLL